MWKEKEFWEKKANNDNNKNNVFVRPIRAQLVFCSMCGRWSSDSPRPDFLKKLW